MLVELVVDLEHIVIHHFSQQMEHLLNLIVTMLMVVVEHTLILKVDVVQLMVDLVEEELLAMLLEKEIK